MTDNEHAEAINSAVRELNNAIKAGYCATEVKAIC